ncbi:hypothetical protein MC885_017083 [Smutsia gigantea]|nr:hypothetical protein MC885_017083 [Smutsia gigantea]
MLLKEHMFLQQKNPALGAGVYQLKAERGGPYHMGLADEPWTRISERSPSLNAFPVASRQKQGQSCEWRYQETRCPWWFLPALFLLPPKETEPHPPAPTACKELTMLTENMKLWHGLVIAVVSLILQACLLAAISYLLGRRMGNRLANESEQMLKEARLQAPRPSPAQGPTAAATEMETRAERSTPASEPCYRHDSGTSSDSSDSSVSSGSSPPTCQATKDINYTKVVSPVPGGRKNESALDYENIKEATDYVNVNPKSHKPHFWTSVKPAVSEPVEYTQVAL